MQRRTFFSSITAGALGLVGLSRASAEETRRQKVVYHLADLDKVSFVLGNMQNHVEGVGGPGNADIRIVIHGPALRAFQSASTELRISTPVEKLSKAQVGFEACANTMRGLNITLADLLPGFISAEKGGVVRLAELQMQGYAYIRP